MCKSHGKPYGNTVSAMFTLVLFCMCCVYVRIGCTHTHTQSREPLSFRVFGLFFMIVCVSTFEKWNLFYLVVWDHRMSKSPEVKDDPMECPLCMEPLEIDDVNFFPCTCGYQICRFCWHRIRTDENGLCPACRKVKFCSLRSHAAWHGGGKTWFSDMLLKHKHNL